MAQSASQLHVGAFLVDIMSHFSRLEERLQTKAISPQDSVSVKLAMLLLTMVASAAAAETLAPADDKDRLPVNPLSTSHLPRSTSVAPREREQHSRSVLTSARDKA